MITIRETVEVDADVDIDFTEKEFLDNCTNKKSREALFNILLEEFDSPFANEYSNLKPKTLEDEIKLKIFGEHFHKYSIDELERRLS